MNEVLPQAAMLTSVVSGAQAWTAATLPAEQATVTLPAEAWAELEAVLAELRRSPVPMLVLDPADYELSACRALMQKIRTQLTEGIMFAVLDRLPVEQMSAEEATSLYWLLSCLVARPVAQKLNGRMVFDVQDTGQKMRPGSGIRPTVTNVDLTFHNDNSYNQAPPDYVCLLCLQTAKSGGVSRVISMQTVHNALLQEHPGLLSRLYRPLWYDRHAEHHEGEANAFQAPMFEYDGRLVTRIALSEIYGGYALRGEALDRETKAALEAVQGVFDRPELRVELNFRPGQIQYVNNRMTGHARTEFEDHPEPERRRHLVRLWLREHGKRGYCG